MVDPPTPGDSSRSSLEPVKKSAMERHTPLAPEMAVAKQPHENKVVFSFKDHAASLLCYEQQKTHFESNHRCVSSLRWFRLLQSMAWIPSLRPELLISLWTQAIAEAPTFVIRQQIDACLSPSSGLRKLKTTSSHDQKYSNPALTQRSAMDCLRLKDRVAELLRDTLAKDPVTGWSARRDRLAGGFHRQDTVVTPLGLGTIRDVRRDDQMCVIVYSWGHGFCHRSTVLSLDEAKEILSQAIPPERTEMDRIVHDFLVSDRTPKRPSDIVHHPELDTSRNPCDASRVLSPDTLEYVSSRCTPDQFTMMTKKQKLV